ncbi:MULTISPECIES: ABC transporter ATP-binding protein [Gordonia]|uniref:Putative ABC transporter ATP-binding protein n=1 Tax=Gordonia sihwensis NBRC 108236 TaxID=1223544 RepID=L7LQB9_9ACTN|nr:MULTISPECIES: ABC transporter ATP-binding protein [Gordonia]AUH69755.1 ABC transporter ATP-binding protein [Gordonia sp. YC-JH1]MBY4571444.1 ABC transporter [Gordonia sihwensis]GAC62283.1 putative ABC transporter ATP-binding protein [Gordonia sihwensis NBRC 108236]
MSEPVLRARSVTRRFGDVTAVDDVSMSVEAGEVVGLIGANGAGKTTLIRMLLGLSAASEGSVEVLGGAPDRDRRARLGYVPQNLGLYTDLTVEENLEFSADAYRAQNAELPGRFSDVRRTLVRDLSLGAQRQAAFAIALAHRPEVLVLDEPTSGVDALARARLWDTIRQQAEAGVGVLVTTHYMEEAQQCDRLLLMVGGRLVGSGSEDDIIGDTRAIAVRTDDWAAAFAALNDADVPVILAGRDIRVPDTDPAQIDAVLDAAGVSAECEPVRATIEERMLVLARERPAL